MVPWRFRWIGETNDYRLKTNPKQPIDQQVVRNAFAGMNQEVVDKFLTEHVPALILGLIIKIDDPNQIKPTLEELFGPIEIDGITYVTDKNREYIYELMNN